MYYHFRGQAKSSINPFVNGDPKNYGSRSNDEKSSPRLDGSSKNEASKSANNDSTGTTSPAPEKISCFQHEELKARINTVMNRDALHIRSSAPNWTSCDQTFADSHQHVYQSTKNQLLQILNAEKRGLVYVGDLNLHCNHLGSYWFMEELNLPTTAERQPYHLDNQTVGTFKELKNNLTFINIQDSGYFISIDQPTIVYKTVENFIKGRKFS